jgi:hypothetical protein
MASSKSHAESTFLSRVVEGHLGLPTAMGVLGRGTRASNGETVDEPEPDVGSDAQTYV